MSDGQDRLTAFLKENARRPELIPPAVDLIQPFFRTITAPPYGLLRGSNQRRRMLSDALSGVLGYPVGRIVPVSIERAFGGNGLAESVAGTGGLEALLRRRLKDRLWHSLGNKLWDTHGRRLWSVLADDRLGQRLVREIQDSLGANRLDSVLYGLRDLVGDCFADGLFYFLGASMAGEAEMARQLAPLTRLLPAIVPLGERAGRPDIWYALTA